MKAIISADEALVKSIPEPTFTKTWHPVGHDKVIDALELAMKGTGMDIVNRHYSLEREGMNVFGTWHLSHDSMVEGGCWGSGTQCAKILPLEFVLGIIL